MEASMKSFRILLPAITLVVVATVFAAGSSITGFPPALQPADLILRDATITTLDPLQPQAQAMAIRDGRIQALGSDASIAHYIGNQTKVLDLHGAFVTPGFIEGHGHLLQTGESLMQINVGKAANWDGVVAMVKAAAAKARPGEWIVGFGWLESKWDRVPQPNLHGLPLPASLNAVSPDNPVLLTAASYHGLYANALALKLAGITDSTPDPVGGTIVRDAQGHAIGMLKDTAAEPVYAAYRKYLDGLPPADQEARRAKELKLAVKK
jgi:predicted amidohydrolase YtcJ